MGYEEAHAYLESLGIDAMKSMRPSMERIEAICDLMNHPEREAPAIHITGTNGKTSTARLAASLLVATGLRVGTYTSPHLQTMRERISLNGEPIDKDTFGDVFDHIKPYIEVVEQQVGSRLSYFEALTAMFFLWAADAPVDAMVVEVGLGGSWDATNVVPGRVACVTNVGLDHTGLFGGDGGTLAKCSCGHRGPSRRRRCLVDRPRTRFRHQRQPGRVRGTLSIARYVVSALPGVVRATSRQASGSQRSDRVRGDEPFLA
ncbi:MAG: Mur ligase family protein [Actinomycetota bacterium]|nr:Mur ligase family protein [Actinomycetota bacterium]